MRAVAPAMRPLAADEDAALRSHEPEVAEPLPAPRLLPKVPFRFCVHADGDRHWMQLEGGTADLVPIRGPRRRRERERHRDASLHSARGRRQGTRTCRREATEPGVAWVVVGIPNDVVATIDAGKPVAVRIPGEGRRRMALARSRRHGLPSRSHAFAERSLLTPPTRV